MSVSRLHFRALADVIAREPGLTPAQREHLAHSVVDALRPFNHRMDRERFVTAATDTPAWVDTDDTDGHPDHASVPRTPYRDPSWVDTDDTDGHTDDSPFQAVGAGIYDAATDRLAVHKLPGAPAGTWVNTDDTGGPSTDEPVHASKAAIEAALSAGEAHARARKATDVGYGNL